MDPLVPRVVARFKAPLVARVVARFIAATTPSRAALAFLTKAAKGIKGGMDIEALKEALPLIGWEIDEVVVSLPVDGEKVSGQLSAQFQKNGFGKYDRFMGGSLHEEKPIYIYNEAQARGLFQDIKAFVTETSSKTGPSSIKLGEIVLRNLNIVQDPQHRPDDAPRWIISFYEAWVGVTGWKLKTSKGEVLFTPKMNYRGNMEPLTETGSDRFWTFAYKAGLKELANDFLTNMGAEVVQNVLKPVDPRTLENTGTCPCCFRNTKMIKTRMMRHGWAVSGQRQRGVWGLTWHTGPCFGVGYEPFEISPEGTKDYLKQAIEPQLKSIEKNLARLKSRPDPLTVVIRDKPQDLGQNDPKYEEYLKNALANTESQQRMVEQERDDLVARIQSWKPRPLYGKS